MNTIDCPTCGTHVSVESHPGILSNRINTLRSDILLAQRRVRELGHPKTAAEMAAALNAQTHLAKLWEIYRETEKLLSADQLEQLKRMSTEPFVETPAITEATELAIEFTDFTKVALRVGTIKSAERVPKSDKLLKMTVDFGDLGQRTILAGIGKTYQPEDVVNLQAVFVTNLKPRKMMGIESHGMLLAVGDSPEQLSIVTPTRSTAAGAKVG